MTRLLPALLVLLLAVVEYRVSIAIDERRLGLALSAIEHLLDGTTHWQVYQARVLTPALLRTTMAALDLPAITAFLTLLFGLGLVAKAIGWTALRAVARDGATAALALCGVTLGWLALHNGQPGYLWDVVDLGVVAAAIGLLARSGASAPAAAGASSAGPLLPWVLLLLVGTLNREGALLLATLPLVDALLRRPRAWAHAAALAVTVAALVGLVLLLRTELHVEATLERGADAARVTGPLHLRWAENLATIGQELLGLLDLGRAVALRPLVLLVPAVPLLVLLLRPLRVWRAAPRLLALALVLVAATLVAGEVLEGRVWAMLLPIDAVLLLAATDALAPGVVGRL